MTWEEALNAIAGAVDVSAFDEELNTIREAMSTRQETDDILAELEEVKGKLTAAEAAREDLQAKYRKRFGEMLNNNAGIVEEKETSIIEKAGKPDGSPLTFNDLSLTAETE